MRIDVYFDAFPHPAKPNLETQLLEWHRQGHTLRLFSLGRIGTATSAFPVTFIRTLRQQPIRLTLKMLWHALTRPHRTWRTLRSERTVLLKLKRLATDAQLPNPPEAHFIHNLTAAVHFSYLKHATPNAPVAIYYHGGELPGVPQIDPEDARITLRRADLVFSNTQASINEVVSRGAVPEKAFSAPTAFPIDSFPFQENRNYLPDSHWRFVCVGRMAVEKGFDIALQAFAALRKHMMNFDVTMIGDGPELSRLEALADQLKLSDIVTFKGHMDRSALIPLLGKFDVFVLSSRPFPGSNWVETQAAVMHEAMLMGTIVVASEIGGVRESLPSPLHQYLYTAESIEELCARLRDVTKMDPSTLRALSKEARRFTLENYDIRHVNTAILTKLQTLTPKQT